MEEVRQVVTGWRSIEDSPLDAYLGLQIESIESYEDEAGLPLYYIVNLYPNGFVIVSGDDLVEPIIGFVEAGDFIPSEENPLGALVSKDIPGRVDAARNREASGLTSNEQDTFSKARNKWEVLTAASNSGSVNDYALGTISDVRVSPLIQSRWSQGNEGSSACYNFYTEWNGTRYVCGCVATAMAQLMRYHQHPTTGPVRDQHTISVAGANRDEWILGGDGSGSAYDWAEMVLDPNSSTGNAAREAIGALTHDAGVSVNMSYTTSGSGSNTLDAGIAFVNTFRYSNARRGYNSGSNIPSATINQMINPNLDAELPALLGITGSSGGHAIVVDGYGYQTSTLYHHLNMGWAGSDDAWYNLPDIDSSPGFTSVYKTVYNVYPSGSGEIISGRVTDSSGNPISGASVTATISGGSSYSDTTNSQGIYALTNVPSGSSFTVTVSKSGYTFNSQSASTGTSTNLSTSVGNVWGLDFASGSSSGAPDFSIASGDITLSPSGMVIPGTPIYISATIENNGTASGTFDVEFYTYHNGSKVSISSQSGVSLAAGGSTTLNATWDTSSMWASAYYIYVNISNAGPAESNTSNNLAYADITLPVELAAFSAERQNDGTVLLTWQSACEIRNKEWRIYRRQAGHEIEWSRINNGVINGLGTAPFGGEYEYVDDSAEAGTSYVYQLEWIDDQGKSKRSEEVALGSTFGDFFAQAPTEEPLPEAAYGAAADALDLKNESVDYLIVVPAALEYAARPLADYRAAQGLKTGLVTVESIYAQAETNGGGGINGEEAIRDYAASFTGLRYLVLVGDAIMESSGRQLYTSGLTPTFVLDIPGVGLTPSDFPYSCLWGDDEIPDVAVGRLPARTAAEMTAFLDKIAAYESGSGGTEVVGFVNGLYRAPGEEFSEASSEKLIADYCADRFDVRRLYASPASSETLAYQAGEDDLAALLKEGVTWLEYRGHGGAAVWAGYMDAAGAKDLSTSGRLPIVSSVSCLTGFFAADLRREGMAEALLRNPTGGVAAYIGNSGLGVIYAGHEFSSLMWDQMTSGRSLTLGQVILKAKQDMARKGFDSSLQNSLNLLGDPGLKVRMADDDNSGNSQAGATGGGGSGGCFIDTLIGR